MSNARDLDILARSLSGDWEARIELFKKYIWSNSRVRRLGSAYQYLDDFLHDCFTNVLRMGTSFDGKTNLGDWVESVAALTALDRQRMRGNAVSGETGPPRMCVEMKRGEGDIPVSYVPPRSGPEDSLASRIAALVGKPTFDLLSKRAIKNQAWEDVAAAAGQPLNTIGPILVRTVDSLSRFFGAPPPLNVDLEPVFLWVVREDAAKRSGPERPVGRILSMQLDPAFYSLTPEMRTLGLAVPADVRTITLWDAARASTPPSEAMSSHLANCHYCADLLRALLLMQRALESGPGVDFLLCPGASTLLDTASKEQEVLDRHLDACPACKQERGRAFGEVEQVAAAPKTAAARKAGGKAGGNQGEKLAWAAAIVLLLGGVYLVQHRYFTAREQPAPVSTNIFDTPSPTVKANPRYSGLAQPISVTDMKWLDSVLPQNRRIFGRLVDQLQHGDGAGAAVAASGIPDRDAGTQMLYSLILYERGAAGDGYQAMLKSEAMSPRNSFRCWATLQCAVMLGDMKTVTREVDHLSSDPEYAARARELLARMRALG